MDTSQTSPSASPQAFPLIAGQRAGKPIRCKPELKPVYDRLQQAARRNHHWARIAVKELNALTTGMLGKNNVYVRPGERDGSTGSGMYYVFLPGLKATVVRWPNDQFCILDLVMDENFYHVKEQGDQRTRLGLYRAIMDKRTETWHTNFVDTGKVLSQSGRLVAVAGTDYPTASEAAHYSSKGIADFLGKNTSSLHTTGCDLHFTPGRKSVGGLICYNPVSIDSVRSSAVHLARSMENARRVNNVRWVSDAGGSAVLTQAMQILVDKNIYLDGHTVYLHKPRTSPAKALRLAHRLNLSVNKSFANTTFSPLGALSQYSVSGVRMKNQYDPYDRAHHAAGWFKGAVAISTPIGVVAAAMSGPASVALGSIAAVIGGAGVTYSIGQSVIHDLRRKFKL